MSYSPSQQAADADFGQLTEPAIGVWYSRFLLLLTMKPGPKGISYGPTPYSPVSPPQSSSYQSDATLLDRTLNFPHLRQPACAPGEESAEFGVNIELFFGSRHASPSPLPSSMKQTAATFFTANFVWNDIICAAAESRKPSVETRVCSFLTQETFC